MDALTILNSLILPLKFYSGLPIPRAISLVFHNFKILDDSNPQITKIPPLIPKKAARGKVKLWLKASISEAL